MIMYMAGNFPQLKDPKQEAHMRDLVQGQGFEYRRLLSFFYKDDSMTVINLRRDGGQAQDD